MLRGETLGFLGLSRGGQPYVVPLNYAYAKGTILLHGALSGKRLDYLRANPRICFTIARQAGRIFRHPQGASCHVDNDSVICYGRARILDAGEERRRALNVFNRCLEPDAPEIPLRVASRCCAIEIRITEATGRQQRGLKYSYWKYRFT
jgi:hypothetical protein